MRRIRVDPLALGAILYLLLVDRSVWALLALGAAALHELGHLAAARLLRVQLSGFTVGGFGACIMLADGLLAYRDEAVIAAAGPAVNLLCAGQVVLLCRVRPDDRLLFFAVASLALALVNLLPLHGFDGGRLLTCLTAQLWGSTAASRISAAVGSICTILMWLAAAALWLRTGGNLSLLALSCLLLWRVVRKNLSG